MGGVCCHWAAPARRPAAEPSLQDAGRRRKDVDSAQRAVQPGIYWRVGQSMCNQSLLAGLNSTSLIPNWGITPLRHSKKPRHFMSQRLLPAQHAPSYPSCHFLSYRKLPVTFYVQSATSATLSHFLFNQSLPVQSITFCQTTHGTSNEWDPVHSVSPWPTRHFSSRDFLQDRPVTVRSDTSCQSGLLGRVSI